MTRRALNPIIPVLICCTGVFMFTIMDVLMKGLSIAIGAYNALLWRGFAATLISLPLWYWSKGRRIPPPPVLKLHIKRGILIAMMTLMFFWALIRLPLAEAIALSFIAPIIALYLAAIILHERIRPSAIVAALAGLAGVIIILSGRLSGIGYSQDALWGVAAVLISATLFSYNLVLQRQQAQQASPIEITCIQNLIVTLLLMSVAPWFLVLPDAGRVPVAVGAAILAICSQFALSWAYARAEAQKLIPMEYTSFLWASIFGWMAFKEPVIPTTLIGTAMIVAGCLFTLRDQPNTRNHIEVDAL